MLQLFKTTLFLLTVTLLTYLLPTTYVLGQSAAAKAMELRIQNLDFLVFMESPMANFGTEQQKQIYNESQKKYSRALALLFEKNYVEAYRGFVEVQSDIDRLYEEVSLNYINKANQLLQVGIHDLVRIDIKYHKRSNKVKHLLRDIQPPYEKPEFDPKEFHFTYNKTVMMNNMDKGFQFLGYAKLSRKMGIQVIKYFDKKSDLQPKDIYKRIHHYKVAIQLSRKAKINAIAIMKLVRKYFIYKSSDKYLKDYPGHVKYIEKNISRTPVLDERIPEEYRVDANDALNKIDANEKKYILELEGFDQEKYKKDFNPNLNAN